MEVMDESAPDEPEPLEPACGTATAAYRLYYPDADEPGHWTWLSKELGAGAVRHYLRPLQSVLEVAREQGCRCVIVEERYLDLDYRSEFSLFWSRRFEDRPPVAKRVHFFVTALQSEQLRDIPADADYIGYAVLRPTALGPVGRTVMRPPPRVGSGAILCTVEDHPNLFGRELTVNGVPFCQQDGELLRCAHAATWLCHYVAQGRQLIGRRTTAEIASLPSSEYSRHRPLPSNGLTGEQMQSIFSAIGLPAFFYDAQDPPDPPAPLPDVKPDSSGMLASKATRDAAAERAKAKWMEDMRRERLLRIACKYINSGFPVVVLTEDDENHAFTLVGWERLGDRVRLYACDDMVGPYEPIDDVLDEQAKNGKWVGIMLPLPEKVFLTGEAAEQMAWNVAEGASRIEQPTSAQEVDFTGLVGRFDHLKAGVSVRTMLIEGRELKRRLGDRDRNEQSLALYRMAHLPHWVWLVEFHDTDARDKGEPCVLAEIVFDSTSHDEAPLTMLSSTSSQSRDHGAMRREEAGITEAEGPGRCWASLILRPEDTGGEAAELRVA
jgi:hypothetical protein